jgi:hypothetical protein
MKNGMMALMNELDALIEQKRNTVDRNKRRELGSEIHDLKMDIRIEKAKVAVRI